jgi:hypothetical protein
VPCCVDRRGADPVPEHDSQGELIYTVNEYYRFTRDVGFSPDGRRWCRRPTICRLARAARPTRIASRWLPYFGLVPNRSATRLLAQPVRSYWDDFRAAWLDAAYLATVGRRCPRHPLWRCAAPRHDHTRRSSARWHAQIGFIPVRWSWAADATSTAVAVSLAGELTTCRARR